MDVHERVARLVAAVFHPSDFAHLKEMDPIARAGLHLKGVEARPQENVVFTCMGPYEGKFATNLMGGYENLARGIGTTPMDSLLDLEKQVLAIARQRRDALAHAINDNEKDR